MDRTVEGQAAPKQNAAPYPEAGPAPLEVQAEVVDARPAPRPERPPRLDRLRDLFRDVTITTPLFNDPDRNYVLGYYKSKETILPFSLDTDWIEANATIRRKLKEQ